MLNIKKIFKNTNVSKNFQKNVLSSKRNYTKKYIFKNKHGLTAIALLQNKPNKTRRLNLMGVRNKGKGKGGKLLMRIIENARKNGMKSIKLTATTSSVDFYKKYGFKKYKKNPFKYDFPMKFKLF